MSHATVIVTEAGVPRFYAAETLGQQGPRVTFVRLLEPVDGRGPGRCEGHVQVVTNDRVTLADKAAAKAARILAASAATRDAHHAHHAKGAERNG